MSCLLELLKISKNFGERLSFISERYLVLTVKRQIDMQNGFWLDWSWVDRILKKQKAIDVAHTLQLKEMKYSDNYEVCHSIEIKPLLSF